MCRRHVKKFYFDEDDSDDNDEIDEDDTDDDEINQIYMLKVQEYLRTGAHKGASPIFFYYPEGINTLGVLMH